MSFVSNLRMRNMFPINSDLGSAQIDLSGEDPMQEIIGLARSLANERQSGVQQVTNRIRQQPMPRQMPQQTQPMNVVSIGQSNPGAQMAEDARREGNRIYQSYSEPQLTAGEILHQSGMRPNDQQLPGSRDNIDIELNRDVKRQQIENGRALSNSRNNPNLKIINITDPNDPTKQISVNYDPGTGTITPVGNGNVQPGASAKTNQAEIDKANQKKTQREAIKTKTQETLDALSELVDDKGELTPNGARAVGVSRIGNAIPATKGYAGSKSIERAKNLITLDLLGEMKAQSKTGATGFGQMNLKELGVLEGGASKLDSGLDEDTFKTEVKRLREKLQKVMQDESESNVNTDKQAPQAPAGYEYVRRPDNKGWTAVKKLGGQ